MTSVLQSIPPPMKIREELEQMIRSPRAGQRSRRRDRRAQRTGPLPGWDARPQEAGTLARRVRRASQRRRRLGRGRGQRAVHSGHGNDVSVILRDDFLRWT